MQEEDRVDVIFESVDYTSQPFLKGSYEGCTFKNCVLSNVNLAGIKFIDCDFQICDLSMATVVNTTLNNVTFDHCKLIGIRFETVSTFMTSMHFNQSTLDFSTFVKMQLTKSSFTNCQMNEVDFTMADLSGLVFEGCDFNRTIFDRSNLTKTNFSTATNFNIDPAQNKMNGAIFNIEGALTLLDQYNIKIVN